MNFNAVGEVGLDQEERYDLMEVCMLAGKILLESGAETLRVEDTMERIAKAHNIRHSESFVTTTAIIFSIESGEPTKTRIVRVKERTTDLHKVALVNNVSREITCGDLTIEEAYDKLTEIRDTDYHFPFKIQVLAATISSGCFLIMLGGQWYDFIQASIIGGIGYAMYFYINKVAKAKLFSEFVTAVLVAMLSHLFVYLHLGTELDKIIIGSVMPLVPGLLITNSVRDLMAGHLLSGISKGTEACLTACAIGAGVGFIGILLY